MRIPVVTCVIDGNHVPSSFPGTDHFAPFLQRRVNRITLLGNQIQTVMLDRHLVERIDLFTDGSPRPGISEIGERKMERRQVGHLSGVEPLPDLPEIFLDVFSRILQSIQLPFRVSYDVPIRNRVDGGEDALGRDPAEVGSIGIEELQVDLVVPGAESRKYFADQFFFSTIIPYMRSYIWFSRLSFRSESVLMTSEKTR